MSIWKNITRRILILEVIGLLGIYSCDTQKDQEKKETERSVALSYSTTSFERVQKGCDGKECAKITLSYPLFESGDDLNASINEHLSAKIEETISAFVMGSKKNQSLDELAEKFIGNYTEFKVAFPESQTGWYVSQKVALTYKGKTFVCLQFDTESYTGGAHPIAERSYLLVEKNGDLIDSYSQLVVSESKLRDLAEDRFREKMKIKPGEKLSDAGFIFENDQFSLPENVGFSKSGMILYYNPYEVADYATGPIEVTLSFNQIADIYKHKPL